MRDEKTPREPARPAFQQPTGHDRTPTEHLPATGGRTETLAAAPLPPRPGDRPGTDGDRPATVDSPADRSVDKPVGKPADRAAGQTTVDGTRSAKADPEPDARRDLKPDQKSDQKPGQSGQKPDGRQGTGPVPAAVPAQRHNGAGSGETVAPKHATDEDPGAVLFGDDVVTGFRGSWRELQADFVDDPMRAVQGADKLVDEVMRKLSETLTAHKKALSGEWQGNEGDTEELRLALRKYRSFLDQLLRS